MTFADTIKTLQDEFPDSPITIHWQGKVEPFGEWHTIASYEIPEAFYFQHGNGD